MRIRRTWAAFLAIGSLVVALWFRPPPHLFAPAPDRLGATHPAKAGMEFSTRFLHSVQKTPVEEFFTVNEARQGFVLVRTRYQSFGVGLPFLAADGTFQSEDGSFSMADMDRPLPRLDLRPGLGTNLTLTIDGATYPLYALVPPGTLIRIYLAPYYYRWL